MAISSMTPQEVNEAIAKKRGWRKKFGGWSALVNATDRLLNEARYGPGWCGFLWDVPDYCGSWDLAGPLFDELRDSHCCLRLQSDGLDVVEMFARKGYDDLHDPAWPMLAQDMDSASKATGAIARAWLAAHMED